MQRKVQYPRLTNDRRLKFVIPLVLSNQMFDTSVLHLFNGVNSVTVVM